MTNEPSFVSRIEGRFIAGFSSFLVSDIVNMDIHIFTVRRSCCVKSPNITQVHVALLMYITLMLVQNLVKANHAVIVSVIAMFIVHDDLVILFSMLLKSLACAVVLTKS